ncbi:hypothetical protein NSU09_11280 [Bacillus sp. PS194]|uniref:hypothetical protein n=1 Tax=Bacillus TaxID=1386 RepID=UPI001B982A69|nr:hypothetical protein [Bacillus subtilis]MCG3228954.1 hypothetical protein [Bacillus subtilis]CAF1783581.1 hypothetical protein NRS6108_03994 [Bacillus subtilis]CAF1899700.1 hypothetical protein NRS6183_04051 [Bacillus subtilis]CAI6267032.1 SPbeta prophage-derived putative protein YosJ [Bacillus subtilis]
MIPEFYKDQKLHLLEDPMQQYTVMKVEENTVCVYRWIDDYRHKIERFTDVEEAKKLLGEGWPNKKSR